MTNTAIVPLQPTAISTELDLYAQAVQIATRQLRPSSIRVYLQTYAAWRDFATRNGANPLLMTQNGVAAFLDANGVKKSTMQRQLGMLRTLSGAVTDLLRMHTISNGLDPKFAELADVNYAMLKRLKIHLQDNDERLKPSREGQAFTPAQADRMLRCFGSSDAKDMRNRALITLLLLTGLRRFEAAKVRWADLDFERGVMNVLGKGKEKADTIPLHDTALHILSNWRNKQDALSPEHSEYVFTSFAKGGRYKKTHISGNDVWLIWKEACTDAGIEHSAPHDARRTLITELLDSMPVHEVQSIARHARGETTLGYAKSQDAQKLRDKMKLRYG